MRKIALAAAAAALLVSAAPVTAEEPVATQPCAASEEYTTLGLAGAKEDVTPSPIPAVGTDFDDLAEQPTIGYHEESAVSYLYRLDLSGSPTLPTATKGRVNINLNWDNDGDYDLYVYDTQGKLIGEGTNGFNPLDGAGEAMTLSSAGHCTDFRIDVVNYLGASPVTAMDLTLKVSNLK